MTFYSRSLRLLGPVVGLAALVGVANAQVSLRVANEEVFADPPKVAAQSALEYIEETVPEVTNGEVTVELYPNAALGSEKELIKSVASGTVDATVMSPGNAAGLIPEVQLFSASYLFNSYDNARRVIEDDAAGLIPEVQLFSASYLFNSYDNARRVIEDDAFFEAMQEIVASKDADFQLAGIGLTGTRNLYSRTKVVASIDDLEGMKMRVMSSPTEFKVWSTLGMLPSNLPAPEIYTSLQTGVIDAAESSLPAIAGNKYYEVAPNITLTNHQFNLHLFLISDMALAKIPEEHLDAVMTTFREAGIIEVQSAEDLSAGVLDFLREQPGVTVTEVDTAPFAEALRHVQDEVAEELEVENLLEIIRSKE